MATSGIVYNQLLIIGQYYVDLLGSFLVVFFTTFKTTRLTEAMPPT